MQQAPDHRYQATQEMRAAVASVLLLAGAAGCARPVPHLALPDVLLGEPSFFPTLEAYAGSPIVGGNAVEVLLNGEEIFPALVNAIHSAQLTINSAQYFYEDGPVARDWRRRWPAVSRRVGVACCSTASARSACRPSTSTSKSSGCPSYTSGRWARWPSASTPIATIAGILVVDGRIGFTGGSGVIASGWATAPGRPLARHGRESGRAGRRVSAGRVRRELAGGHRHGARW
jgi:cardiolipin synthase